jgi:hypothetical protein
MICHPLPVATAMRHSRLTNCKYSKNIRGTFNGTDDKTGKVTATIQEIAHYNMLLTEAIFELLAEKGILTGAEVRDRVTKLKSETALQFRWLQ